MIVEVLSVITCALVLILIIAYVVSQTGLAREIIRLQELLGEISERCYGTDDWQDTMEAEMKMLRKAVSHESGSQETIRPIECELSYCKSCGRVTCSIIEGNTRRCAKCGSFKSAKDSEGGTYE